MELGEIVINNIHTAPSMDKEEYLLVATEELLRQPQLGLLVTSLFTAGGV
jgi:hypothetical protein